MRYAFKRLVTGLVRHLTLATLMAVTAGALHRDCGALCLFEAYSESESWNAALIQFLLVLGSL
jgi:hypothetical protein